MVFQKPEKCLAGEVRSKLRVSVMGMCSLVHHSELALSLRRLVKGCWGPQESLLVCNGLELINGSTVLSHRLQDG